MRTRADEIESQAGSEIRFDHVMVALDASPYADRALAEALRLAKPDGGAVTGIHAYAAALHDRRFRQMEGGLPDRYLVEKEMTYQREVHDSLITRGLDIISDSYHDAAGETCEAAGLSYGRLSPEGKNYACIIAAAEAGEFDVLALGSLGLGAIPGSLIGTVCERVARRSPIDTLVIKDPKLAIGDGPIVVGMDGSGRANGALMTAFEIARRTGADIHVVAAYDPYYHYVAFNAISGVLSEEAGKVFRFKEQEQLHEELIDDGIAKIYQSHLDIAGRIAKEQGVEITRELLDGKPFKAIQAYLAKVGASLLVIGKTGVHADDGLDIGGNAENLLRLAPCHVWLGQKQHTPDFEVIAEETISWSNEAVDMLGRAPSFVQALARKAVLRHAHDQGHTFITSDIVKEVMGKMMPGRRGTDATQGPLDMNWSTEALGLLERVDGALVPNIRLRAEKRSRRNGGTEVSAADVVPFLDNGAEAEISRPRVTWAAAALARIARSPDMVRDRIRIGIEDAAVDRGLSEITLELAEEVIGLLRQAMCPVPEGEGDETPTNQDES